MRSSKAFISDSSGKMFNIKIISEMSLSHGLRKNLPLDPNLKSHVLGHKVVLLQQPACRTDVYGSPGYCQDVDGV